MALPCGLRRVVALLAPTLVACSAPPDLIGLPPLCAARGPAAGWFVDATAASGLAFDYQPIDFRGGALAVADLDGDDRLDVVAGSRAGGLGLFAGTGGLRFTEVTGLRGLDPGLPTWFVAPADLDGDGDLDLAVSTGAGIVLYEAGPGGFARRPGRLAEGAPTEHILPVDLDRDGRLDLYLANREPRDAERSRDLVVRNRGRWRLEVEPAPGERSGGQAFTASALDHDGDGDLDLYVANDTFVADFGDGVPPRPGPGAVPDAFLDNQLVEQGTLGFVERADPLGLGAPRSSMGGLVADLDGDWRLDLHVSDLGRNEVHAARADGGFAEISSPLGLDVARRRDGWCADPAAEADLGCLLMSWGAQAGDFDLDGNDDLVVLNGLAVDDGALPPQLAFRGPAPFTEVDAGLGCFEGHGLVAADLDDDGDLDLLASVRQGALRVFENRAARRGRSLALRLSGAAPNVEALGAVVEVSLADGRRVLRPIGAGGVAHAAAPARVLVGTGEAPAIGVRATWPSGATTMVAVPEGASELTIAE